MEVITSVNNTFIKELKKQMNDNLLFLDTPKLIEEALKNNVIPKYILVQENLNFDFIKNKEVIYVSKRIIDLFSSVQTSQGIVLVIEHKKLKYKPPSGNFLVLDNLQDTGNVGTLIRSALGANFKDVYLINCASISNIKTVRASMGAVFSMNVYECTKAEFIENFKNIKNTLLCCDMQGENIYNFTFPLNCGIVIGNEGNGVSEEIREICNQTIKIPMENNLESLNAGVSGSIIMYQINNGGKNVRS